ncbi:RICIN domain-containing protein [Streptomyces sp. NPDC001514]
MRTTRTKSAVAAALAGALMAAASPAIAHAQSLQRDDVTPSAVPSVMDAGDGKIGFQNYKSGKLLQPSGGSTANGAKVVQQPVATTSGGDLISAQNWKIVAAGGSYYSFQNVRSGKNLGINGASTAAGAGAIQANPAGDINQDWQLVSGGHPSGVYSLKNRKSGLCLGIPNASTASGAQAAQFRCDGTDNQGWKIIDG